MDKLSIEELQKLRDKYLGKKVLYEGIGGICNFIGYNQFIPSWGLQITINRMPIQHVDPAKIQLMN